MIELAAPTGLYNSLYAKIDNLITNAEVGEVLALDA
jgi:hypothetical protein